MMTEREIWVQASVILARYGDKTSDYIIDELSDVLRDPIAVENWRRVAAAVDMITSATVQ